jgi:hypothetical protein
MSLRATWLHPDFVRAINFVDVVFYKNKKIRAKLREFLTAIKGDMGNQQVFDNAKDLLSEMVAMMGKELNFQFGHTEIKDTAYYPKGHAFMDESAVKLREKALAVLDGIRAPRRCSYANTNSAVCVPRESLTVSGAH